MIDDRKVVKEDKVSFGIMKTYDDGDSSLSYTLACNCGNRDCSVELSYDIDDEGFYVSMRFDKKLGWFYNSPIDPWTEKSFYRKHIYRPFDIFRSRLKAALNVIFHGVFEVSGDIILQDERHIQCVVDGLQKAFDIMKERKAAAIAKYNLKTKSEGDTSNEKN